MPSLWGTKKDDGPENAPASHGDSGEHAPQPHEANERSRLLPPPPQEGYLSPDDPAVSPYNLWSVRILRYFTVFFAIITFLWWVLLLVSIFVSPPGMHSRGSGFFDFSYTTLTMGLLIIVLLFFSSPSKAGQVTCLVLSILLLFDMVMILAVPRLRVEEGWVGIASVAWAVFMSIWTVITDRIVAWGKHEEEERLTGRSESRRTLREWSSVFISTVIIVILAVVALLLSATLVLRAHDASLSPPGERYYVDGGKYQVHLFCSSKAKEDARTKPLTTVLFEAGTDAFEGGMIVVAENALKNGSINRYCYYDRPGLGWSDNAPSPFSAGMAADVLGEALARAGEEGPWVLASAGVGSIYSRVFSSRHGTDIKGLLMIDPLHEDLLYTLGSTNRGFLLWAWGIISPLGLDRVPAALFKGRTRQDRVYGRSSHQNGKYIKAKLQESLVANSLTRNEVRSARTIQNKYTPLVLISSGINVRKDPDWEAKQRDLSHLTHNLTSWDVVNKAPAEVWKTPHGRDVIEKGLRDLVAV